MRFISAFVVVATVAPALFVNAQTETSSAAIPTSTEGITPCILDCVSSAADSAGCSSFADLQCVCTSEEFQNSATPCLQDNCSEDELQVALDLQNAQCAAIEGATSVFTSLSSAASSIHDSVTSQIDSITSSIGSEISDATGGSTSTADDESDSDSSGLKVAFSPAVALSLVVGILGFVVGGLVI